MSHFGCNNKRPDRSGKEREGERDGQQRGDRADPPSSGCTGAGIDPFLSAFLYSQSGKIKEQRTERAPACARARTPQHGTEYPGSEEPAAVAAERGRMHRGAWAVLRVDAFSAEPSDTRLRASVTFTFACPKPITMKASSHLCVPSQVHKVQIKGDSRLGLENASHRLSFFLGCTYSFCILFSCLCGTISVPIIHGDSVGNPILGK